ncbi:protein phosphatase 1 regulatory subunit 7-like [Elysia marginata]|uniref:Protein phosphatase 1 regulatory subunit 7-like n=1 Tax=Elysia marginata TaxID=1093978 RepID=A0AAV4ITK1_9GAST|nr:protein phosphatase 1 regulatory subunit 7-like [Elysia marginata]
MNTQYNSSASGPVSRALGRPVGVLPLGPRSAVGRAQRRTGSIERRPFQKTSSTGSISSARSILSDASASSITSDNNNVNSNRRQRKPDPNPVSLNTSLKPNKLSDGNTPLTESRKLRKPNASESAAQGSAGKKNQQRSTTNVLTNQVIGKKDSTRKQQTPDSDIDDNEFCEGQDVKFFDIPSTSRPSTCQSARSGVGQQERRALTTKDILDLSQETEPYKVYEVDLHGESLTSPPDLEKFRKLRVLDLSGNHIQGINGLDFNWDLRELKLYDNEIRSIEGLTNLKELCHLQLQHNQISKIGRGLGSLKKLQTLRLDNNKLTKIETPELLSCSNITTLDLSSNRLETSLEEMNVNANRISELSNFVNVFPKLQILFVCDNMIKAWDEICSLDGLRDLVELSVTANPFTLEDGDMPAYMTAVSVALPNLEVIDGAQIKRAGVKPGGAPLMRPMSAASVISVRQVDSQLKAAANEQENFHKSIADKFASLRSIVDSLPSQPPRPSSGYSQASQLPSRCSSRSRIREARNFAASNFDDYKGEEF